MEEAFNVTIAGRRVPIRLHPYLIAAAAALTLAYTIIGWNEPTVGLHHTVLHRQNEFGLAIAVVVLNSLVALVAIGNIGSVADISAGGKGVGLSVAISLGAAIGLGAAGVSIANATTVRRKRGDALGISAVILSSLTLIGPMLFMLAGAQNLLRGFAV